MCGAWHRRRARRRRRCRLAATFFSAECSAEDGSLTIADGGFAEEHDFEAPAGGVGDGDGDSSGDDSDDNGYGGGDGDDGGI